jgi:putative acetyltransferase
MISVHRGDPRHPGATRLLQASHALMQASFPAESNHYLSIDALCAPEIHFFVATEDDQILGCGAIAEKTGYGEIKSMFTAETARGRGVADLILTRLTDQARALGLPLMRLETGNTLYAAHRLYRRHGFADRGPFGDYPDDPISLFMEKAL